MHRAGRGLATALRQGAAGAASAPLPEGDRRREPEKTVLHAVVREHLETLLAVFLFSFTGLPPLAGVVGKFYLFAALLKTHLTFFHVVTIIGVLNSVVSRDYYARIVKAVFLEQPRGRGAGATARAPERCCSRSVRFRQRCWASGGGPLAGLVERASHLPRQPRRPEERGRIPSGRDVAWLLHLHLDGLLAELGCRFGAPGGDQDDRSCRDAMGKAHGRSGEMGVTRSLV